MAPNSDVGMVGDAIVVGDASRASSQRNRKPSAKRQESQANQEIYETAINGGPKAPKRAARATTANATTLGKSKAAGPNGDDATGWQVLVEVMGNLREIVIQQQDTINDLHDRLKETQTELREAVSEIQGFKTQATEEWKHVHERLDTIGNNPALDNYANTSPHPSYAEVAKTPPNSSPGNVATISPMGTTPSTMTDTLYCTIDTSRVASSQINLVSPYPSLISRLCVLQVATRFPMQLIPRGQASSQAVANPTAQPSVLEQAKIPHRSNEELSASNLGKNDKIRR